MSNIFSNTISGENVAKTVLFEGSDFTPTKLLAYSELLWNAILVKFECKENLQMLGAIENPSSAFEGERGAWNYKSFTY